MKRVILTTLFSAAVIIVLLSCQRKAQTKKIMYPETQREDISEIIHGIMVEDPYRWLEEDTPEVKAWQAKQNALTQEILDEWPYRQKLRDVLRSIPSNTLGLITNFSPVFRGDFRFQYNMKPSYRHMVLTVTERSTRTTRVLIDPNTMAEGSALDWFYPSPNGEYVAYGISRHGDEQSVLHVIETWAGKVLPKRIPHTSFARITWLPDSSGFFYSGGKASDLEDSQKWIFFHRLENIEIEKPDPKRFSFWYLTPQLSPDGRYLMVIVGEENPRAAYYKDLAKGGGWKPLMEDKPGDSYGEFIGDSYLALTTYKTARGRIISIPLATAQDENTWKEVVPESEAVMRHFVKVDNELVIAELYNAYARLRIVSLDGKNEKVISLPDFGLLQGMWIPNSSEPPLSVDGRDVYFSFVSFTVPFRIYKYNLDSGKLEPLSPAQSVIKTELATRQVFYESKDGTRVSMFMAHRKDLDISRPNPTLLHGYGGWNILVGPSYLGHILAFIEYGGIYAFPNLRGGGEYGRDWWHGGRRKTKQNTFDDFYAAAEYLIESNVTSRDLLAIYGHSNGGLLTGVAVTQRPDLYKAVVVQVPILDMVRYHKDPYIGASLLEYGDPRDREMFPVLYAYSPVHNVRKGGNYPATLVWCGALDVRCPPWHGRKFVALLQHATASDAPILLEVMENVGHRAGISMEQDIERSISFLGFVMQQLGMSLDRSP